MNQLKDLSGLTKLMGLSLDCMRGVFRSDLHDIQRSMQLHPCVFFFKMEAILEAMPLEAILQLQWLQPITGKIKAHLLSPPQELSYSIWDVGQSIYIILFC